MRGVMGSVSGMRLKKKNTHSRWARFEGARSQEHHFGGRHGKKKKKVFKWVLRPTTPKKKGRKKKAV